MLSRIGFLLVFPTFMTACGGGDDSAAVAKTIVHTWSGATVDTTRLPLGDRWVKRDGAAKNYLFYCAANPPPTPVGAQEAGPWIDQTNGTWDATRKLAVEGVVTWPAAEYGESVSGATRSLVTNGLPLDTITGVFPIMPNDPAYRYDRNPNEIRMAALRYDLPTKPVEAASPACLPAGPIGVLRNGVPIYASVDELLRDAVAWETQDDCHGHPQQQGAYHYHDASSCLRDAAQGPSTVIGWAADGYAIVVERDAEDRLPTNAELDQCHGRTSDMFLDGKIINQYHYVATLEFPYAIGCFHGTPVNAQPAGAHMMMGMR